MDYGHQDHQNHEESEKFLNVHFGRTSSEGKNESSRLLQKSKGMEQIVEKSLSNIMN